jgi:hypothetical protein
MHYCFEPSVRINGVAEHVNSSNALVSRRVIGLITNLSEASTKKQTGAKVGPYV